MKRRKLKMRETSDRDEDYGAGRSSFLSYNYSVSMTHVVLLTFTADDIKATSNESSARGSKTAAVAKRLL
jgi:hypothetical protein